MKELSLKSNDTGKLESAIRSARLQPRYKATLKGRTTFTGYRRGFKIRRVLLVQEIYQKLGEVSNLLPVDAVTTAFEDM